MRQTIMNKNELKEMIVKEIAIGQLELSESLRQLLKEQPEQSEKSEKPEKTPVEKRKEAMYSAYQFIFDSLTHTNSALKKLMDAMDSLEKYKNDPDVKIVIEVILKIIQNDLSPSIDRFAVLSRHVKKLVF